MCLCNKANLSERYDADTIQYDYLLIETTLNSKGILERKKKDAATFNKVMNSYPIYLNFKVIPGFGY